MKKKPKIIRKILSVILILILFLVVLIYFFGNMALKTGIEVAATKTLKVGVR